MEIKQYFRDKLFAMAMRLLFFLVLFVPGLAWAAGSLPDSSTVLVCGENKIYMIKPALIGDNYRNGIVWEWDSESLIPTTGFTPKRCSNIDDCKSVGNGQRLAVTSSHQWAALIDIASKEILFHTDRCICAHSIEMLPEDHIVVACSDRGDCLQVYSRAKNDSVLYSTPLPSAHGVVWMDSDSLLYAIGGRRLNIYSFEAPALTLIDSVETPRGGLHDLTKVDDSTLCVAGNGAFFFDTASRAFSPLPLFNKSRALKSVNCRSITGPIWYTDATNPEGTHRWTTQTVRHATHPADSTAAFTFSLPDLDAYKVRVLHW